MQTSLEGPVDMHALFLLLFFPVSTYIFLCLFQFFVVSGLTVVYWESHKGRRDLLLSLFWLQGSLLCSLLGVNLDAAVRTSTSQWTDWLGLNARHKACSNVISFLLLNGCQLQLYIIKAGSRFFKESRGQQAILWLCLIYVSNQFW